MARAGLMDSWRRWTLAPPQLTYKDSQYLFTSDIPERKVVMYSADGVISSAGSAPPERVSTRLTTADFFSMFEVPFLYGSGWSASADKPAQPDDRAGAACYALTVW